MTLSQELTWRGFVNQTTYGNPSALDGQPITFYLGVDPSSDSMTIGNLAIIMMVRHFIDHGHKAILLAGGATGLIGDPDGKTQARELKKPETIQAYAEAISAQFKRLLNGQDFTLVNNYDWFNGIEYLGFLRDVGVHVPMRQMLGREFVQSRLRTDGNGISYAEFSYALIQGYDFVHLYREYGATLQLCGADQWGNSIAGVDLIRRMTGAEAHVWSAPLVINKTTGVKFGKSEAGAVWLDPAKTSPTEFYQFWINADDEGVSDYLKIYTLLVEDKINEILDQHAQNRGLRHAQTILAKEVTTIVHGQQAARQAELVTTYLTSQDVSQASDQSLDNIRTTIAHTSVSASGSIIEALVATRLVESNGEARRLLQSNAISINGQKVSREQLQPEDFQNGRLLLRRGKAFKDSALLELI
jgi:tyrosyl-tRNA synthetase